MVKLGFLLIILFVSGTIFSQTNEFQSFEKLDTEKVKNDIKIIKAQQDSVFFYIKSTYCLIKEEARILGWRQLLKIVFDIYIQYFLFICLYLLWLVKRKL